MDNASLGECLLPASPGASAPGAASSRRSPVKPLRVAVAGFMHESNTCNPLKTDKDAFLAQGWHQGPALVRHWRDAHHEVGGFLEGILRQGAQPRPLLMAWATPAGPVTEQVFEEVL